MSDQNSAVRPDNAGENPKEPLRKTKKPLIYGIIALAVVGLGSAFWVWHETPGFCNAVCHSPMDATVNTYNCSSGSPATDKWGNPVPDGSDMLVVVHKEKAGADCLTCHIPTFQEQVTEVVEWTTGNYYDPLAERSIADLNAYGARSDANALCMNEACHNTTRNDLARATSALARNPHAEIEGHPHFECSDCHKSHRQSVNACSGCHEDAKIPKGWLTVAQATALAPHAGR